MRIRIVGVTLESRDASGQIMQDLTDHGKEL